MLIIEDNKKINDLLTLFARQDGHFVMQSFSGEHALDSMKLNKVDVVITDLMLPHIQGEDLIKKIREISDIYIIVISAKIDIKDKLDVLKLGADDYVTKPFSVEEVMLKLKHIEKRMMSNRPLVQSFYHGNLMIYPIQREVHLNNVEIKLTPYEYDVFWHLVSNKNRIYSRDDLIEILFSDSEAFDRVIDAYIKNIRKKLSDDANHSKYIKTHYGLGYQFVGESDD